MIGADGRGFIIDLDYAIDLGSDQTSATECDQKKRRTASQNWGFTFHDYRDSKT
jgi:hypothetical protein